MAFVLRFTTRIKLPWHCLNQPFSRWRVVQESQLGNLSLSIQLILLYQINALKAREFLELKVMFQIDLKFISLYWRQRQKKLWGRATSFELLTNSTDFFSKFFFLRYLIIPEFYKSSTNHSIDKIILIYILRDPFVYLFTYLLSIMPLAQLRHSVTET